MVPFRLSANEAAAPDSSASSAHAATACARVAGRYCTVPEVPTMAERGPAAA
jgi:hypothetical protein